MLEMTLIALKSCKTTDQPTSMEFKCENKKGLTIMLNKRNTSAFVQVCASFAYVLSDFVVVVVVVVVVNCLNDVGCCPCWSNYTKFTLPVI